MDLKLLREATRPEHEATEGSMPLMGSDLTAGGYREVLQRLLPVVLAWERWSAEKAPAEFREMVAARRRSGMLRQDLRRLGSAEEGAPSGRFLERMREMEGEAAFAGALYVMEGSTLGGQLVARQVEERLHFAAGEGTAYFRGFGEQTGERWREVKERLGLIPEERSEIVIEAARRTFRAFGEAMETAS